MSFRIEFTKRAVKELKKLPVQIQKQILNKTIILETEPFQFKNKIKKIKGFKFPCFRLRADTYSDSYRIFYGIEKNIIFVLRIIAKKDADKIIAQIRKIDFPPDL
ncbi:type II toxin-antitoxin system RelE/ParE family toxin [bacterium]|nr:type II toxin-antitoxin system RelE/ParE family toxin [bacterium]